MNPFRLSSRVIPNGRAFQRGRASPSSWALAPSTRAGPGRRMGAVGAAGGATAVPWCVVARSSRGVIEIAHRGEEPLRAVRFALAGGGMLGLSLPRTVYPGESLRVVVRGSVASGAVAAPDAMLVLRWFQPDGTELLWPVAL